MPEPPSKDTTAAYTHLLRAILALPPAPDGGLAPGQRVPPLPRGAKLPHADQPRAVADLGMTRVDPREPYFVKLIREGYRAHKAYPDQDYLRLATSEIDQRLMARALDVTLLRHGLCRRRDSLTESGALVSVYTLDWARLTALAADAGLDLDQITAAPSPAIVHLGAPANRAPNAKR